MALYCSFEGVCLTAVILAFARRWGGSVWGCLTPYPRSPSFCAGLRRMSSKNRDLIGRLQTSASWTTPEEMSSVKTGQMSVVETGQMSAVETGQMSAAETGLMSAVERGQM